MANYAIKILRPQHKHVTLDTDMEDQSFFSEVFEWLGSSGFRIAIAIGAFWLVRHFGGVVIRRIVKRSVRANAYASKHEEEQRENTLVSITNSILRIAIWFVATLVILDELGVDLGPFIAGASIFGVALGFGAQSLIKDFTSGMFIILENQYRVGDIVTIAGITGRVVTVNIRDTVLRDLDGHVHYVPNGSIDVATNMTMEYSGINLNIGVGYDTDIEKAQKLIDDIGQELATDPEWREYFVEPIRFLRIQNFGDSAVELKVLGRVKPAKQWMVAGEFRRRVKIAFDKHEIEIPFPQRVVHSAAKITTPKTKKTTTKKKSASKK